MESINPFWFPVVLIATFAGSAFLVLTIIAGITSLVVRPQYYRIARIVFFAMLACTAFAGSSWLVGVLLAGTRWP